MNDEFVLDKAFCCPGFQNAIRSAAQRGLAILVKKTPSGIAFLFQSRGIAFEDVTKVRPNPNAPDISINVSCEAGFRYCPWCGTPLQKLVNASSKTFEELAEKDKHLVFTLPAATGM